MKFIGINGYGTIGKRVSNAIKPQEDMKLVGITKRTPNFEAKQLKKGGYDIYMCDPAKEELFADADIKVAGTIDELHDKIDLIIDCMKTWLEYRPTADIDIKCPDGSSVKISKLPLSKLTEYFEENPKSSICEGLNRYKSSFE